MLKMNVTNILIVKKLSNSEKIIPLTIMKRKEENKDDSKDGNMNFLVLKDEFLILKHFFKMFVLKITFCVLNLI